MSENKTQQLRFELDAICLNGKNYIFLSKEEWTLEEIEDVFILTKKVEF